MYLTLFFFFFKAQRLEILVHIVINYHTFIIMNYKISLDASHSLQWITKKKKEKKSLKMSFI